MCYGNSYADRDTKFFTKPHSVVIRVASYSFAPTTFRHQKTIPNIPVAFNNVWHSKSIRYAPLISNIEHRNRKSNLKLQEITSPLWPGPRGRLQYDGSYRSEELYMRVNYCIVRLRYAENNALFDISISAFFCLKMKMK